MEDRAWQRLLAALVTLASAGLMVWMEMPPARRELIVLQVRSRLRRAAARLARASGHRAMGRELAGTPEDEAGYGLAYRLAKFSDQL